ncbi:MAG: metallophosphoesterase family protein [Shinella sp.]
MKNLLPRMFRNTETSTHDAPPRRRIEIDRRRSTIYAIGDIHGCLDALLALEARILADVRQSGVQDPLLIYLGDYIDRGPDSKAVLSHIARQDHGDGIERIALCGNHDDTFLRFIHDPANNAAWMNVGGDATLRSYGLGELAHLRRPEELADIGPMLRATIPNEHVTLLENLPVMATIGTCLFVHAGIRPGIAIEDQTDRDLLWIREPFLSEGPRLPINVIHGHTAGAEAVFGTRRICIDTGCYKTGRLTALKATPDGARLL